MMTRATVTGDLWSAMALVWWLHRVTVDALLGLQRRVLLRLGTYHMRVAVWHTTQEPARNFVGHPD